MGITAARSPDVAEPKLGTTRILGRRILGRLRLAGVSALVATLVFIPHAAWAQNASVAPGPATEVVAVDHPWDEGEQIDVSFKLSTDDLSADSGLSYVILRAGEYGGQYTEVGRVTADNKTREQQEISFTVAECERLEPYFFRVVCVGSGNRESETAETTEPVQATRQLIAGQSCLDGADHIHHLCRSGCFHYPSENGHPVETS